MVVNIPALDNNRFFFMERYYRTCRIYELRSSIPAT